MSDSGSRISGDYVLTNAPGDSHPHYSLEITGPYKLNLTILPNPTESNIVCSTPGTCHMTEHSSNPRIFPLGCIGCV